MFLKINNLNFSSMFIDLLRVSLGCTLLIKGLYFLFNMNVLFEHMSISTSMGSEFILAHIIVAAHIVGGLCITIGLLTRIMAAINFPILFGAITLVHLPAGKAGVQSELEIALITFTLICTAIYYGSSKRSIDYMINHQDDLLEHDFLKKLIDVNNRKLKHNKVINLDLAKSEKANHPLDTQSYKNKSFRKVV